MAINRLAPTSTSTEGIVTVKITGPQTKTTVPTPLAAGTYRINTGYNNLLGVKLWSGSTLRASTQFITSTSITITDTATEVEILGPSTAVNGVVSFEFLTRGVNGTLSGWNVIPLVGNQHNFGQVIQNSDGVFIIGGTTSSDWSSTGGTGTIEKWDRSSGTTTVVYTNSILSYGTTAVNVGSDVYIKTHQGNYGFYKFNTSTNTWTALANSSYVTRLNPMVINNAGTKIYVFGSFGDGNDTTTWQVYDIATNAWSRPSGNFPWGGAGYGGSAWTSSTDSDKIYVANMHGQGSIYRYNIAANSWSALDGPCHDGWHESRGVISPSGDYYWKPSSASSSSDLSTNWFDIYYANGSASVYNIATYAGSTWGMTNIQNNVNPGNHQGVRMAKDATNVYMSGFVDVNYSGKLFYRTVASAFPASGIGS